jgi:hypothetical protein
MLDTSAVNKIFQSNAEHGEGIEGGKGVPFHRWGSKVILIIFVFLLRKY